MRAARLRGGAAPGPSSPGKRGARSGSHRKATAHSAFDWLRPLPRIPPPSPTLPQTAADVSVAMGYDFNSPGGGSSNSHGFKLNFDVRELNLVCRI